MDILLSKVTQQAMNYAIRSGIAITSTYAMRQCSRLVKTTPRGSDDRDELLKLQIRLESKIRIISPAIDMIELIAARGNTSLESAVTLTKELRWEIQALGVRLANAANEEDLLRRRSKRARSREENELELKRIVTDVKQLLNRIEDAVPLINLAITTSGVNLSTNLPATVSPSRLLQASTFLTAADSLYAAAPGHSVNVGPVYTLSMYMLFAGHANRPHDEESIRETTWKEVIHKARVKLVRVPIDKLDDSAQTTGNGGMESNGYFTESASGVNSAAEFAYQLVLIEDIDDDRVHTFEEEEAQPGPYEDVAMAGIREVVPVHQISKIFYADTGKILNIGTDGETNNPVLLVKRDIHAEPPRRMMERQDGYDGAYDDDDITELEPEGTDGGQFSDDIDDEQAQLDAQILRESTPAIEQPDPTPEFASSQWRLPPGLDPEWIAFEVYNEEPDSDDEEESEPLISESSDSRPTSSSQTSVDPVTAALSDMDLHTPSPTLTPTSAIHATHTTTSLTPSPAAAGPIKTSLSLLEMLIRLTSLQQFRQASHLTIEDELLNFFLEDSATTGAGANADSRQRIRRDARRRVGFDPYDESPIKRRGEEYLAHPRGASEAWQGGADADADADADAEREGDAEAVDGYWDTSHAEFANSPHRASGYGPVRQSIEDNGGGRYARWPTPYSPRSSPAPRSAASPSPSLRPATKGSRAQAQVNAQAQTRNSPGPGAGPGAGAGAGAGGYSPLRQQTLHHHFPAAKAKSRSGILRGQEGVRPRSPLGRDAAAAAAAAAVTGAVANRSRSVGGDVDSALGTSPDMEDMVNLERKARGDGVL